MEAACKVGKSFSVEPWAWGPGELVGKGEQRSPVSLGWVAAAVGVVDKVGGEEQLLQAVLCSLTHTDNFLLRFTTTNGGFCQLLLFPVAEDIVYMYISTQLL